MRIKYIDKRFNRDSIVIINKANDIIDIFESQGYSLTLRQLYYQFVAMDLFPRSWFDMDVRSFNSQKNYKKLGTIINNARLAGLIDWCSITDLTRKIRQLSTWENPIEIIESALYSYRIDKWKDSNTYVEVWVEKDALIEVVEKACKHYEAPCFSCRGYVSQSAMWKAAQRFNERAGKTKYLLHLGDHDPSGIDMTRDIRERLLTFRAFVHVERIALNMQQIQKYNPPPNPAKLQDTRCKKYIEEYGNKSWELDALEPSVIDKLIKKNIKKYLDKESFENAKIQEEIDKERIQKIVDTLQDEYET